MQIARRDVRRPLFQAGRDRDPFGGWLDGSPFEPLLRRMARLRELPAWTGDAFGWLPSVDIVDRGDKLVLTAELPGVRPDDVEVHVEDHILTLKGVKRAMRSDEDEDYRLWEREFGAFERSFSLPRGVDDEEIRAEFADGLLTVHLPMTTEARGQRIEITNGES